MLVVAADDGPRAQTLEHVALLDALGVAPGIAVVTKIDAVEPARAAAVVAAVADLLAPTSLAGSPVLAASGVTGEGLEAVRAALDGLRARPPARLRRPPTLAIDRVFSVKGRGAVVTGTLRGGPLARGDTLRLVPGDRRGADPRDPGPRRGRRPRGGWWTSSAEPRRDRGGGPPSRDGADGGPAGPCHGSGARDVPRPDRGPDRARGSTRGRWRWMRPSGAVDAMPWTCPTGPRPGSFASRSRSRSPPVIASSSGAGRQGPIGGAILDVAPPRGISRRRQTAAARRGPGRHGPQAERAARAPRSRT